MRFSKGEKGGESRPNLVTKQFVKECRWVRMGKMEDMMIGMMNTQMSYLLFGIDTKSTPHAINKQCRLLDKNKPSLSMDSIISHSYHN